jgi:hypothetical protein
MRALGYSFFVCLALGCPAHALDITLDGAARAAAIFHLVAEGCGREFKVDIKRVQTFESFGEKSAIAKFGQEAATDAFASELKKQQSEVQTVGLTRWCLSQQRVFDRMGIHVIAQ